MTNWFIDKQKTITKFTNAIYDELSVLLEANEQTTANYWIDKTHNVFAEKENDNRNRWITVYFELYDFKGEQIGDIDVIETLDEDNPKFAASLLQAIKTIVNEYFYE